MKWSVYRQCCRSNGHSISRPSLPKVADFLLWFRRSRNLSVSSVTDYRSTLATVFRSQLPNLSSDPVLSDLVRSFWIETPIQPLRPPAWDLSVVLHFPNSPLFEPLHQASLRDLMKKVLFLVTLATTKRVGELQAVSRAVSFVRSDACLSYVPGFVAKTSFPIPFLTPSWWLRCLTLRLGWTMTCRYALSEPSVYTGIWIGLPLFLLFLAVFFCPLGGHLTHCRKMPFLSSYVRSSMGMALVGRRWVP